MKNSLKDKKILDHFLIHQNILFIQKLIAYNIINM
jgi:hypothetical protein